MTESWYRMKFINRVEKLLMGMQLALAFASWIYVQVDRKRKLNGKQPCIARIIKLIAYKLKNLERKFTEQP